MSPEICHCTPNRTVAKPRAVHWSGVARRPIVAPKRRATANTHAIGGSRRIEATVKRMIPRMLPMMSSR
jgi:hypothetical protein